MCLHRRRTSCGAGLRSEVYNEGLAFVHQAAKLVAVVAQRSLLVSVFCSCEGVLGAVDDWKVEDCNTLAWVGAVFTPAP